jgi:hypothetical protein
MPGISDHCIPYLELQLKPVRKKAVQRQIPLYHKADWGSLRTDAGALSDSICAAHTPDSDPEEIWSAFRDGITSLVKQHVPHKTSSTKPHLSWVDYQTRRLIRRRDRLHKKWKKTADPQLREKLQTIKHEVQRRLRRQY